MVSLEEIKGALKAPPTVVTHRRPDVDALSSAYVMAKRLGGRIAFEEEPDTSAKVLAEKLSISWLPLEEARPPYVVVDSSSKVLVRLPSYEDVVAVIDHHRENENTFHAPIEVKDPSAQSTAELVAGLIGVENLDRDEAFALATGIYTDTNLFYAANNRSMSLFTTLLERSGRPFQEVVEVGYPKREWDEMKALAEGMRRLSYEKIGDLFTVFTEVGTKAGTLSNVFSKLFDLAFVLSWDDKEKATRVSARASKYVDVDLSSLMFQLGKAFSGGGGGHRKAAGALCYAPPERVKEAIVGLLKERLEGKP